MDASRRFQLVAAIGLAPWSVISTGGATTVFFSLGFLNLTPPRNFVGVIDYVFVYTNALPEYILAWPIGIVVYAAALGSASLGLFGHEDRRVTAILLVLLGLSQLSFAWGFQQRPGCTAIPIVTITTLTVAWWVYWPAIRRTLVDAGTG
jgi:uncharacterized protein (TIGR04206 family)